MMCKHKSVSIPYQKSNEYLFVTEQIRSIIGLIRPCYALLQILVTVTKETRYGYYQPVGAQYLETRVTSEHTRTGNLLDPRVALGA